MFEANMNALNTSTLCFRLLFAIQIAVLELINNSIILLKLALLLL